MGARTGRLGCQTCSALLMLLGLMGSRQGASVHTTVFGQFSFRIYFKEELPQVFRHFCRSYGLESHAHQATRISQDLASGLKPVPSSTETVHRARYHRQIGLYKMLFHFEALLHNNIFCKHPLNCAIYCTILPVIAAPTQFWGVFGVF